MSSWLHQLGWMLLRLVSLPCNALCKVAFLLRLGVLLLETELLKASGSQQQRGSLVKITDGAEEVVSRGPAPGIALTDLDRIEGLRYLTRLVRGGLESFVECSDARFPLLRPVPFNVRLGADNPDNLYLYGSISGDHTYRIHGHRGSVTYLSFACYAGSRPGQGTTTPGHVDSSQLRLDASGRFEVVASVSPPSDATVNWLRMEPGTTRLVVRQTFLDRGVEFAATINIERVINAAADVGSSDASDTLQQQQHRQQEQQHQQQEQRPALLASDLAAALTGSALFINGAAMQFADWAEMFAQRSFNKMMVMDKDKYMSAWADPSIYFFHGWWSIKDDEALVIEVTPPKCVYWNFQLNNRLMESLPDDEGFKVHVNKRTAVTRLSGEVCIVVAHRDPRLPGVNYLGTARHEHGTMALRWVLAESHPVPKCRVTSLAALQAASVALS